MTNIVQLLWIYLGGMLAGAVCIGLLYIAGLSGTPRRYLEKPHSFGPPLVLGAAIFVIFCWYGIKLQVPLIHLIRAFGCLAVLLFFVGKRWRVWDLGAKGGLLSARRALFVYAWFYFLTFIFLLPSPSAADLPIVKAGPGGDLFLYISSTAYLQRLGASNISSFDFPLVYLQTPGVFHLIGLWSASLDGDAMRAAMPILYATVALIGCQIVNTVRAVFNIPMPVSILIGSVLISGPFFRYIYGNYFLSQLMGSLVLISLLARTIDILGRNESLAPWRLTVAFLPYAIVLFYVYPVLSLPAAIIQVGLFVLQRLVRRDSTINGTISSHLRLLKGGLTGFVAVFASIALVALTDLPAFWHRALVVSDLASVNAGWPLGLISLPALLGIPAPLVAPSPIPHLAGWALFGCIGAIVVGLFFRTFGSRARPQEKMFVLLCVLTFIAYPLLYLVIGPSYRQWKFASYFPLIFSFVFFAVLVRLVQLQHRSSRGEGAASERLSSWPWVIGPIGALLIIGNIGVHVFKDAPIQRFASNYRALQSLDQIGDWQEIGLRMFDLNSILLAQYFVRTRTLHFTQLSDASPVADDTRPSANRPQFIEGEECAKGSESAAISFKALGCLYLQAPTAEATFERRYRFTTERRFVSSKGLSAIERWGRWSDAPRVELSLEVPLHLVDEHPTGFINIELRPLLNTSINAQRTRLHVGNRGSAWNEIKGDGWISLPYEPADWTGPNRTTLAIALDLPDAFAPSSVDRTSSDNRRIALGFLSLALTREPLGRVIELGPERP